MKYLKSKLKDRVKSILQKHPKTRESNNAFMAIIWKQDMENESIGYKCFLNYLQGEDPIKNTITNWDSATRAKRKVQENNIELRGETYQKRKDKEAQIAEELRQGLKKSDIIDYDLDFEDEF